MTQMSIDDANATIFNTEKQALESAAQSITALNSAVNAALTTLGTGGPSTPAKSFLTSIQAWVTQQHWTMTSTFTQYGLNPDGTEIVIPTTTAPSAS